MISSGSGIRTERPISLPSKVPVFPNRQSLASLVFVDAQYIALARIVSTNGVRRSVAHQIFCYLLLRILTKQERVVCRE